MPNWEAVGIIGGGALILCVILSAAVIGIRRLRVKTASTEGVMPRAGLVLYGIMALALVVGFAILPSTGFDRFGGLAFLAYAVLLAAIFALIASVLERRGVRVTPKPIAAPPPNNSLERTREG